MPPMTDTTMMIVFDEVLESPLERIVLVEEGGSICKAVTVEPLGEGVAWPAGDGD